MDKFSNKFRSDDTLPQALISHLLQRSPYIADLQAIPVKPQDPTQKIIRGVGTEASKGQRAKKLTRVTLQDEELQCRHLCSGVGRSQQKGALPKLFLSFFETRKHQGGTGTGRGAAARRRAADMEGGRPGAPVPPPLP